MVKWILPVLCLLVLLAGCVKEPPAAEPSPKDTEATVQPSDPSPEDTEPSVQTTDVPTQTTEAADPKVPANITLPDITATPGEMPSTPKADAEIPPQPQPPIESK